MTDVVVNINTYTTDGPTSGKLHMGDGGFNPNLFLMLGDMMVQFGKERLCSSPTNVTPGSGSKTFNNLTADVNFPIGSFLTVASFAAPTTKYMYGVVTSYTAGATPSVTINVAADSFAGAAATDWRLATAGQRGPSGAGFPAITVPDANKTAMVNSGGTAAILDYAKLQYAQGNSLTPTFSADITLTASSEMMQVLAPTVAGLKVTLPAANAAGMLKHPEKFILFNTGSFDFAVRNNAGTLITVVQPRGRARLAVTDISTAAGVWLADGTGLSPFSWQMSNTTISGGGSHSVNSTIYLTETLCVFISVAGSIMYATAYDISTNTLGTTTSLGSLGGTLYLTGAMDATRGLVVANTSTVAFSVSGTTVTVGGLITTPAGMEQAIILSATQAMIVSNTALDKLVTGLYLPAAPSVTLAAGTATAVFTSGVNSAIVYVPAVKRSATQVILVGCNGSGPAKAMHVTISGASPFTGITKDSEVVFTSGKGSGAYYGSVCSNLAFMATDEWWCFYWETSDRIAVGKITVSGVTLSFTQGTAFITGATAPMFQGVPRAPSIVKIATNKIAGHANLSANTLGYYYVGTMTTLALASGSAPISGYSSGVSGHKPHLLPSSGDFCGYVAENTNLTASGAGSEYLVYIDETFPGDAMVPGAITTMTMQDVIAVGSYIPLIRMTNYDILVGHVQVNPGRILIRKRTAKALFEEFTMPAFYQYTMQNFGITFAHIGTNKLAFGGYNGAVFCVEIASSHV